MLVIEVSDTTLLFDRRRKSPRYARAGIRDYWIVNLLEQQLEVYRNVVLEGKRYQYGNTTIVRRGESIAPLAAPQSPIAVDDLLP
ncbi:MAG TPA: Uma2 family endonuclease [Tepidisphaeraceae bacterium]|nr:Uma2 family endonuclease [Tepidisphaeraceae bacterium]